VTRSGEKFLRHRTAIGRDTRHHRFVEPHVHLRRVALAVRGAAELRGERLTSREAAIHIEQLEQVHNGSPPVELLRVRRCALLQHCGDTDRRCRRTRWCGRGRRARRCGGACVAETARAQRSCSRRRVSTEPCSIETLRSPGVLYARAHLQSTATTHTSTPTSRCYAPISASEVAENPADGVWIGGGWQATAQFQLADPGHRVAGVAARPITLRIFAPS
jgi:hypothetical protein